MAVRLSALGIDRALLPRNITFVLLVLISVTGRVNRRAIMRPEGIGELKKNSFTSLGLEPATFRLVA
jgi:hypothetical protein